MNSFIKQLTRDEAIAFYEKGEWQDWSNERIAAFQLYNECLCVPFAVFHEAMTEALGRDVYTHEFANTDKLQKEYEGIYGAPTFQEILEMIPEGKRIEIDLTDWNDQ